MRIVLNTPYQIEQRQGDKIIHFTGVPVRIQGRKVKVVVTNKKKRRAFWVYIMCVRGPA